MHRACASTRRSPAHCTGRSPPRNRTIRGWVISRQNLVQHKAVRALSRRMTLAISTAPRSSPCEYRWPNLCAASAQWSTTCCGSRRKRPSRAHVGKSHFCASPLSGRWVRPSAGLEFPLAVPGSPPERLYSVVTKTSLECTPALCSTFRHPSRGERGWHVWDACAAVRTFASSCDRSCVVLCTYDSRSIRQCCWRY